MRVVVFLVVVCGCRVAASSDLDANATQFHGDGLPERVITDAPLWSDLRTSTISDRDGGADAISGADRLAGDPGPSSDDALTETTGDLGPGGAGDCALLAVACVGEEGCYPFPFEGAPNGATRCAFQGVGVATVPCQSQLECDRTTLCSSPGQPDSVCLQRCDLANPQCPTRQVCTPYFTYPGLGVCR